MESGCDPNSPECWCPCGCGCQNDPKGKDLPFSEDGICASCNEGKHEIPPNDVSNYDRLVELTQSYLEQLKRCKENQLLETPQEALTRWEKDGLCDPNCAGCQPYYEAVAKGLMPWTVFQPNHKASAACRSGGYNHCTCDACF